MFQEISEDVSEKRIKSFIATMRSSPYQAISKYSGAKSAFGLVTADQSAQRLVATLKPGFTLEKINLSDAHLMPVSDIHLTMNHEEVTEEHLKTIE
ncbi:hypothetical protein BGX27_004176, partial [Mortierella sp. AM989]